jgi:hypothetical protein
MADLTRIDIIIQTGSHEDAGTDGSVYVGICRREFCCDTTANDFERGSNRKYIFGEGSNVLNAAANDPRKPQLILEDVDRFPIYIRLEQGSSDAWLLQRATVHLNEHITQDFESFVLPGGIWLGKKSGAYLYLQKHINIIL